MGNPVLHLASASPRRRDILTTLGIQFSCAGVNIDESASDDELAEELVMRLACEKASAAVATLPVLGADTIVICDNVVLGKPASRDDALDMLARLSGRLHRVLTSIAIMKDGRFHTATSATDVRFREINDAEAQYYWDSGEPVGKAGAYAIQGKGGVFVESIAGSYSGVVGLPVYETAELLRSIGIELMQPPKDV